MRPGSSLELSHINKYDDFHCFTILGVGFKNQKSTIPFPIKLYITENCTRYEYTKNNTSSVSVLGARQKNLHS